MNTGINYYSMIIYIFYNFVVIDPASVDILIYVLFFSAGHHSLKQRAKATMAATSKKTSLN